MEHYNELPLHEKLGIKEGFEVKLINEPENFIESLNGIRDKIHFIKILNEPVDLVHLFTRSRKELQVEFPRLKIFIRGNGSLWISWPKESSIYVSDLNENIVREIGKIYGFVDSKSFSIDENWNALKFINPDKDKS